jgi:hypothetical protein
MTTDEKLKYIHLFENLSYAFDDVFKLSNDVILFRPFEDAWSIKEQIVHCLEVDMANFHRYRRAIAQPETQILSFDQIWTSALNYQSSDIRSAIDLIKMVRKYMASHLKTIVDNDWTKYAYIHDKKGRINLEEAIKDYIDHVDFHRKLVDRNIEMFNKKRT